MYMNLLVFKWSLRLKNKIIEIITYANRTQTYGCVRLKTFIKNKHLVTMYK